MPGEPLVRAALGQLYLGIDDDFASETANGSMYIVRGENSERMRGCLVACDLALAQDLDNFGAPAVTLVLASQYSFEMIAGLPEAGIASAVQQLAYQFQCLKWI
jgi:hypothetical protein